MDTISYSSFRSHLASILDKVNNNQKPIMITRQKGETAVLMSVEAFNYNEETAYLMASPENAKLLNQAIADVEAGKTAQHKLIEE